MRNEEQGGRPSSVPGGASPFPLAENTQAIQVDPRVSGMIAHANLRGITKDVAKELLFAEAYIETERLVLKPVTLDDFEAYAAMLADPDCWTYSTRGPMTADEAYTRLLRQAGHWALLDYGLFAVFEKTTDRFIGEVGYGDFHRELGDDFDKHPEAAWTIMKPYQGKRYASEAAYAALEFTEDRLIATRTVCMIHHENKASIRIARKLGFKAFDEIIYRGFRAMLFAREH